MEPDTVFVLPAASALRAIVEELHRQYPDWP